MTLHLGLPHSHHRTTEQQQEIREARRMLKEKVRTDWNYPSLPQYQTRPQPDRAPGGFKFHIPPAHGPADNLSLGLDFEPAGWREREYSSAESGSETEAEVRTTSWGSGEVKRTISKNDEHHHAKKLGSIFKFEGPDSVGPQLEEWRIARRHRRQKALHDESQWNDGLAHWLDQRDTWCCARNARQVQMLGGVSSLSAGDTSALGALSSASISPRTSTSTASSANAPPSAAASSPSTTPDIAPSKSPVQSSPTALSEDIDPAHLDVLIPLAQPMLPNHPIRRRITPALYPEIYSKIIVSGRTPSVPINLLTLTRALVQGWKDDGEWPPKQGPVEKSIGRRKGTGESVVRRAVGKVLRITTGGSGGGADGKG